MNVDARMGTQETATTTRERRQAGRPRNATYTASISLTLMVAVCACGSVESDDRSVAESLSSADTITDYTGLCVDVQWGNSNNGTPVQLWTCNGTDAQRWSYKGGSFVGLAGKCLDVQWSNTTNGTPVQLWDCNGTGAQQWSMQGGQLVGVGGKCLDVNAFNSVPGQTLQIWDCTGGQNQQFDFHGSGGADDGGGDGGDSQPAIRVAAGATSPYTDPEGNTWSADTGFTGGAAAEDTNQSVQGTNASTLYDGQRYGVSATGFQYSFPVAAGTYKVTLKFTENWVTGPGQRLFGVSINGQNVLTDFDIYAESGGMWTAVDKTFTTSLATAGPIAIDFIPGAVQSPKVDAIDIEPVAGGDAGDGGGGSDGGNPDPCQGQNCSGHGTCVSKNGAAACSCDPGYFPNGLACIAGTADISVDLATPTGKQLSPYLYGVCVGSTAYGFNHNNDFDTLFNGTFQTSAAVIHPALVRTNTQQTLPMLQYVFRNGVANPDWTDLDNWIDNHAGFFDDSTGRLIFSLGPLSSDTSVPPSTFASWAAPVANHFKSKGQEIFWWEVGNEDPGMGAPSYLGYFDAIADALHAVNPQYKVGGPVNDYWDDNGLGAAIIGNSPSKIGFVNWHTYGFEGNATPTSDEIYARATSGQPISNVTDARAQMRAAGISDSVPLGMTEYNMLLDGGDNSVYQAALFAALYLSTSYKNDPNFQMGAVWDLGGDYGGGFGLIGNSFLGQDYSVIDPQGYYLGYAGQNMGGAEVTTSTSLTNFDVIVTKPSPNRFAIQLVNYDTGHDATVTIGVSGGTPTGTITRWEIGKSNPSTPSVSSQPSLVGVSVPSEQAVILTGTLL
jgi:hypothetical protein